MYEKALAVMVVSALSASWLGFASVTAFSCSFGREPNLKENGIIRWVMPLNHRLRCQCTSIYPGGFNTYTPERGFDPFYTDRPLFTDLKTEIFNYFECENCSLTCGNGGTFIDDPCHCSCAQNWTGKTCTKCALTSGSCANDGKLNQTNCMCTCTNTWMGNTCAENIPGMECSNPEPLGLEDGTIPDESISASSTYYSHAGEGRLNGKTWIPKMNDVNSWLEVDLGESTVVSGVITQGEEYTDAWRVTEYKMKYKRLSSSDNNDVIDHNGAIQVFNGNIEDATTPVTNMFDQSIVATIVRIEPVEFVTSVALRLELLGCHIN